MKSGALSDDQAFLSSRMNYSGPNQLLQFEANSDVMLIAFGGNAGELGVQRFEFLQLFSNILISRAFFKDPDMFWYQNGIPGIGKDVDSVAAYLREVINSSGARRIITVGNSAGGYAAILFGVLVGANEILAFSPHTRIEEKRDSHYPKNLDRMLKFAHTEQSPYRDLHNVIKASTNTDQVLYIFYSQFNRLDRRHATRLKDLGTVTLMGYPCIHHGLIKLLKVRGRLNEIVDQAIAGEKIETHFSNTEMIHMFLQSCAFYSRNLVRRWQRKLSGEEIYAPQTRHIK